MTLLLLLQMIFKGRVFKYIKQNFLYNTRVISQTNCLFTLMKMALVKNMSYYVVQ